MDFNDKASRKYDPMTVEIALIAVKADFDTVGDGEKLQNDISNITERLLRGHPRMRTDNEDVQKVEVLFSIAHHGLQIDFLDCDKPDEDPFHTQYFGFGDLPEEDMDKYKISPDPHIKAGFVNIISTALDLNMKFADDGFEEVAAAKIFEIWYHHEVLANPAKDQTYFLPYGSNNIS